MTRTSDSFPAPGHDHERCEADGLRHAEKVCTARGEKLTPLRRNVLACLLASHRPLGAYELIEQMGTAEGRPAPITVYRVLEFLQNAGLVHRIESRNAFIACGHSHDDSGMIAFLICDECGSAGELHAGPVAKAIMSVAQAERFKPRLSVIEVAGLCAHCQRGKQ